MKKTIKANAKINLSLDILNKRADGYHEVKMIMQSIDLHDEIAIEINNDQGISIKCNNDNVPTDDRNIAYSAAKLLFDRCGITKGVVISINKNIPIEAGLAGGSCNAAAVLLALNDMLDLKIDNSELLQIGKQIGADVPFCMVGGTMLSQGIGEILTPLAPLDNAYIVLVKPPFGVSTKWVYSNLKLDEVIKRPDVDAIIKALERSDIKFISNNMVNVLETVTENEYPKIEKIKKDMIENGALGSLMSGSGSTVFGLFDSYENAVNAAEKLKENSYQVFIAKTTSKGVEF